MLEPLESHDRQLLSYAHAPAVRTSVVEIVLGVIALICGVMFVILAWVYGALVLPRQLKWQGFIPLFIMLGAGVLGCVIGIRALRRWRTARDP